MRKKTVTDRHCQCTKGTINAMSLDNEQIRQDRLVN